MIFGRPSAKGVLFDLDDTLFDHAHSTGYALAALRHNHPVFHDAEPEGLIRRYGEILDEVFPKVLEGTLTIAEARHIRFSRLLEQYGGPDVVHDAQMLVDEHIRLYREAWRPVPGAHELLETLSSRVHLGVVTNGVVSEQRDKLERCGIDSRVEVVVISQEAGASKPRPEIYREALEKLDRSPEETVMVGNSWQDDVLGALRVGMSAVWLNRNGVPCPDPTVAREIVALEPAHEVAKVILGEPPC